MSDVKKIILAIFRKITQSLPCRFSKARLSIQIQVFIESPSQTHTTFCVRGDYKMIVWMPGR